jgi:hypothetical protein
VSKRGGLRAAPHSTLRSVSGRVRHRWRATAWSEPQRPRKEVEAWWWYQPTTEQQRGRSTIAGVTSASVLFGLVRSNRLVGRNLVLSGSIDGKQGNALYRTCRHCTGTARVSKMENMRVAFVARLSGTAQACVPIGKESSVAPPFSSPGCILRLGGSVSLGPSAATADLSPFAGSTTRRTMHSGFCSGGVEENSNVLRESRVPR